MAPFESVFFIVGLAAYIGTALVLLVSLFAWFRGDKEPAPSTRASPAPTDLLPLVQQDFEVQYKALLKTRDFQQQAVYILTEVLKTALPNHTLYRTIWTGTSVSFTLEHERFPLYTLSVTFGPGVDMLSPEAYRFFVAEIAAYKLDHPEVINDKPLSSTDKQV